MTLQQKSGIIGNHLEIHKEKSKSFNECTEQFAELWVLRIPPSSIMSFFFNPIRPRGGDVPTKY